MQCQNCKQETSGLKINGKLFCTNCGEELLDTVEQSVEEPLEDKVVETEERIETLPTAKIITPEEDPYERVIEDEIREIDILGAEEQILELIEKESQEEEKRSIELAPLEAAKEALENITTQEKSSNSKNKEKTKTPKIVKHKRKRVAPKKKNGFTMIPGEPNPITSPELPIPHDDMIEEPVKISRPGDKKDSSNFFDQNEPANITLSNNVDRKQAAMRAFLKKGTIEASRKNHLKKSKKSFKPKKITIVLAALATICLLFVGLVLYVNFYAIRAEKALKVAEEKTTFEYNKAKYLPAGYKVSYQTKAEENAIEYVYSYLPQKSKTITIKAEKSDFDKNQVYSEMVALEEGSNFILKNINETEIWLIGDNKAVFVFNKTLYQIESSDTISSEEILKIAEGII